MLFLWPFTQVDYLPTEVEGRRKPMCGAVAAAATCLTLPSFPSAGGSDLEDWWDPSEEAGRPVSSTTLVGPYTGSPWRREGFDLVDPFLWILL